MNIHELIAVANHMAVINELFETKVVRHSRIHRAHIQHIQRRWTEPHANSSFCGNEPRFVAQVAAGLNVM